MQALIRYSFDELRACIAIADPPKRTIPKSVEEAGGRNNYLTSLAGGMRKRGVSREEILAALGAINGTFDEPLQDEEVSTIARSVSRYEPEPTNYALTDLGNAERFVAICGGQLRFCTEREIWYRWDGTRWDERGNLTAKAKAHDVARSIGTDADDQRHQDAHRKALRTWANRSESAERLAAMTRVAGSIPSVQCSVSAFDANPWLLNCQNGTLNLRNGQLEPHNMSSMCSRLAPVRFIPGARHPILDSYLDLVTESDPDLIHFLQRCFGYSLTGDVGAEVIFLVLGPGGSGKTTLVEALKEMLGDYGATVQAKTLLSKRLESGHSSDVARLHGRRMVGASEFEKGARLDAALIKGLTGGERVTARNIYEAEFEFRPMAKFWLAANDPPVIDDNDTGMWRRVLRIPFEKVIPPEKRSDTAKAALAKDPDVRSALLAWALQGCLDWQAKGGGVAGLAPPARVLNATTAYRRESNPLAEFFEECCDIGTEYKCTTAALRGAYARWAKGGPDKPMSQKEFSGRIRAYGIKDYRTKTERGWVGVRLIGAFGLVTESGDRTGDRTESF